MASWRVLIPAEHGVWGLVAASALVGLGLSHGLHGMLLLVAAVLVVAARAAMQERAWWWAGATTVTAIGCACGTWLLAGTAWLPWAAAGIGLGGAGLLAEHLPGPRRWWIAALAGVAFASLAGAVASAGGAAPADVAGAVAVMSVHLVAMTPLVRALIRRGAWPGLAITVHLAGACLLMGLWGAGLLPVALALTGILGLARAVWMLHECTPACSPRTIGTRELAYTVVVSAIIILGLRWG